MKDPAYKDILSFTCLVIVISFVLVSFCLVPELNFTLDNLEKIGAFAGGVAAVIGVPFLIINFKLQRESFEELKKEQLEAKRETEFKLRCDSIEAAFKYVSNVGGNAHGAAAIIQYGELCKSGSINIDAVIRNVGTTSLKAVLAGLLEVVDWTLKDKEHFIFHTIYRVRFVAILLAFENMMVVGDISLSKGDLQRKYLGQGDKYTLILSIWDLHRKDFDLWVEYEQFKVSQS